MGVGVLTPRAENGVGEGGSEFVQTRLADGVATGETKGLDHESLTAAALEQTGWGRGLEGQRGFQLAAQSRKECARLLAVRGHATE